MRSRYRIFAQAIKNIINAIGTITSIVPKSGCAQTRNTMTQRTIANGTNHSLKVCRYFLYCLKNAAKYTITANFRNSVGCRLKGTPGIEIHPLAHL
jgi:hypothetical protein